MLNFQNWLINESFDSVTEFLLNPEHRHKTWNELMREFEASGGQFIGSGTHAQIYSHPNWPYLLKTYNDQFYTRFVRFAFQNPHPAFPKFYGPPKKVIPFYKRTPEIATIYLVRMEKLEPIDKQTFALIDRYWELAHQYFDAVKGGYGDQEIETKIRTRPYTTIKQKYFQEIIDILKQHPKLHQLFEGMYLLRDIQGQWDIHKSNFMKRSNGDIIIIDPFWEGSNPYADYQRAMDMEIDALGNTYDPKPEVIGGELPKRKRKKKLNISRHSDDIPF